MNRLLESDIIKEEKSLAKYKQIVSRSISGKPFESIIGYQTVQFSEEDTIVICSDGVHNVVSVEQVLVYSSQKNGLQELERPFLRETEDNYSIIVIEF